LTTLLSHKVFFDPESDLDKNGFILPKHLFTFIPDDFPILSLSLSLFVSYHHNSGGEKVENAIKQCLEFCVLLLSLPRGGKNQAYNIQHKQTFSSIHVWGISLLFIPRHLDKEEANSSLTKYANRTAKIR